jgi:hypothetical protein
MSRTVTELASLGGHARAAALTPEQRRSSAKKARLSGLVNAVPGAWTRCPTSRRTSS